MTDPDYFAWRERKELHSEPVPTMETVDLPEILVGEVLEDSDTGRFLLGMFAHADGTSTDD